MYKITGADGQQYGPVSAEQVRRWLAEGRLHAQSLIQPDGATDWKPLSSLPEFSADIKTAPPVLPGAPPSQISVRAANKVPAGILAILLGSLGIHKFILGYTRAGLIMLLVTVLTCGLGAIVFHVIGLIEGILYLCKTDEEFVRIYVDGRREWF